MIDIRLIRESPKLVEQNIKRKGQDEKLVLLDKVIKLDENWRALKYEADNLRKNRNVVSEQINQAKKNKDEKKAKEFIKKAKKIPEEIAELEQKDNKLAEEIRQIMNQLPNFISPKVPIGKDASENVEIKKVGKPGKFDFPAKNHVELTENLGVADFEASARVSGKGFYYLKNELAILNQALIRYAMDFLRKKKYEYIETPLLLNEKSIFASMNKTAIEQSVYSVKDEDLNLIGTAEQSLLAMHSGNVINEEDLPKKYYSYSMCFRKEIGAHGINEK